jgi:hypothetical protein
METELRKKTNEIGERLDLSDMKSLNELDEMLESLGHSVYSRNDKAYGIIMDFFLEKHLSSMNSEFAAEHSCFSKVDAASDGGKVSKVGIKVLRSLIENLKPIKTNVIEVELHERGVCLTYAAPYTKYAEKIKQDYDQILKPTLHLEMNLVLTQIKNAKRQ